MTKNFTKGIAGFLIGFLLIPTVANAISAAAKYEMNNKMGQVAFKHQLGTLIESAENSLDVLANGETILNGTDDTVTVASDDEAIVLQLLGFESKAATLTLSADESDDSGDDFSLSVSTADVLAIKNESTALLSFTTAGAMTAIGSLAGDGGDAIKGFKSEIVAATSATATIAQCGATFVGASDGNNTMVLPEASTALGCTYTFVCGGTDDIVVDPADGTDQIGSFLSYTAGPTIALIAPSAGDSLTCVSAGSQITLRAVANDLWQVMGSTGIITDTN